MAGRTRTVADAPLSEQERAAIGEARDLLKKYGQYVDVADMSDVAYERRQVRMKSMDLVAALAKYVPPNTQWVALAKIFENYIWEGLEDADVRSELVAERIGDSGG